MGSGGVAAAVGTSSAVCVPPCALQRLLTRSYACCVLPDKHDILLYIGIHTRSIDALVLNCPAWMWEDPPSGDGSGEGGPAAEAERVFRMFDADDSGEVDADELQAIAAELGKPLSEPELKAALAEMDRDGGGAVDDPLGNHSFKSR